MEFVKTPLCSDASVDRGVGAYAGSTTSPLPGISSTAQAIRAIVCTSLRTAGPLFLRVRKESQEPTVS